MKVAIIGGGISGLTAGFFLKKESEEKGLNVYIKIFEKKDKTGGTICSIKKDGFLLESGPNGFLDSKPLTLELIDMLGLKNRLIPSENDAARRYIFSRGKFYSIPVNPIEFIKSPLLSLPGKIRVFLEPFIKTNKNFNDESVGDFVRRRLGQEALDKLIGPMVNGIYAGDPERLSMKSAFSRIFELEQQYGSLIKAMMKLKRGGAPQGRLTSFDCGMSVLIDGLTAALKKNILVKTEVKHIEKKQGKWFVKYNDKEENFDVVLFAIPSYNLSDIFIPVKTLCKKIQYSALNVVHLGYKKEKKTKLIDGFGFLTTKDSDSRVLGVIFASNIFKKRAREGYFLITAMAGGMIDTSITELGDNEILDTITGELKKILQLNEKPDLIEIIRHKKAIPNYQIGYSEIKDEIERILKNEDGLFLAGNAFYGVGVNDTVKRAKEVTAQIITYIKDRRWKR